MIVKSMQSGEDFPYKTRELRQSILGLVMLFICLTSAQAVILLRTGDTEANTTAPSNDPAASGWNYEGIFGDFLGTPIAPHFFLSAGHIGQAGPNFVFAGVTYTLITNFNDPYSDLNLWQVSETFPSFAPLYTKGDEKGLRLVAIGRGTQRGNSVSLNGEARGWDWGGVDHRQRWGENFATDIISSSGRDDFVYATFDQGSVLQDECHLSSGDSGGAVLIFSGERTRPRVLAKAPRLRELHPDVSARAPKPAREGACAPRH